MFSVNGAQSGVKFQGITVMGYPLSEGLKTAGPPVFRDKFVGKANPLDPELSKGNYSWYTMPDKQVLFVSGEDRWGFLQYQKNHEVYLKDHYDANGKLQDTYYDALKMQAHNYVQERLAVGDTVYRVSQADSAPEILKAEPAKKKEQETARQSWLTPIQTFLGGISDKIKAGLARIKSTGKS